MGLFPSLTWVWIGIVFILLAASAEGAVPPHASIVHGIPLRYPAPFDPETPR